MQALAVVYVRVKLIIHYGVHVIINNVSGCPEIDWVDDLVVSVVLIAIEIFRLTTVACRIC